MIICDGCNVREPWEHKCHGDNAVVQGVETRKPCECQRCIAAGLPVHRKYRPGQIHHDEEFGDIKVG